MLGHQHILCQWIVNIKVNTKTYDSIKYFWRYIDHKQNVHFLILFHLALPIKLCQGHQIFYIRHDLKNFIYVTKAFYFSEIINMKSNTQAESNQSHPLNVIFFCNGKLYIFSYFAKCFWPWILSQDPRSNLSSSVF